MYGIYNGYGGLGNMMGFWGGGIMMLVVWVAIIIFIVWIVKEINGKNKNSKSNGNALDILKERYAKGEINKQEFEEKKKDLS